MRCASIAAAVFLACAAGLAWNFPVHGLITRAAFLSLPAVMQERWEQGAPALFKEYCAYPDLYAGASPARRAALRPYCTTPRGRPIHNVTGRRDLDLESLEYLLNGVLNGLRSGNHDSALQFAGVLAHFLEDSTCPSHALVLEGLPLESLREPSALPPEKAGLNLHGTIERGAPAFDLGARRPQQAGDSVREAAETLLDRCYAAIKEIRAELPSTVRAVYADDEETLSRNRRNAAIRGAELLADAYYTVFVLSGTRAPSAAPSQ